MESWQFALVVIAAVLAGVAIPTLVQYRSTLRSIERVVHASESDVRRTLQHLAELSSRMNRLGGVVEGRARHVGSILESLDVVAGGLKNLQGSLKAASIVGTALAPAVSAMLRGGQSTSHEEAEEISEEARDPSAHAMSVREGSSEIVDGRGFTDGA